MNHSNSNGSKMHPGTRMVDAYLMRITYISRKEYSERILNYSDQGARRIFGGLDQGGREERVELLKKKKYYTAQVTTISYS